jgi:DNA-binding transcriptional ArsR family regulator
MNRRRRAARPLSDSAALFAALGDATRLRIVSRLCDSGPLPTLRLGEGGALTRQAVSKHLQALEEAGLVRSARIGRERIWELRPQRLDEVRELLGQVSAQWDQALLRLRAMVES